MLKQTITYTDFNDDVSTDTLYFNITKTELTDRDDLIKEFTAIQNAFSGEPRQLSTAEIRRVLDLVKLLIKISYGERSIDGKRFAKSEEAFTEFTQTAAYDAFLFSLFEDPNKAVAFILGIFPADLRKEAEEVARTQQPDLFVDEKELTNRQLINAEPAVEAVPEHVVALGTPGAPSSGIGGNLSEVFVSGGGGGGSDRTGREGATGIGSQLSEPEDTHPAWIRENREPTKAELTSMSRDQLQELFTQKLRNSN